MGISVVAKPTVTPTITAAPYSANDAVGGRMEFTEVVNDHARSGTITGITVIDKSDQGAALDIFIFDATFTATADNAAFPTTNPTEAVIGSSCIGIITIATGNDVAYSGGKIAVVDVNKRFRLPAGTSLFAQAVTRGTPTYAATSDLVFHLHVEKD